MAGTALLVTERRLLLLSRVTTRAALLHDAGMRVVATRAIAVADMRGVRLWRMTARTRRGRLRRVVRRTAVTAPAGSVARRGLDRARVLRRMTGTAAPRFVRRNLEVMWRMARGAVGVTPMKCGVTGGALMAGRTRSTESIRVHAPRVGDMTRSAFTPGRRVIIAQRLMTASASLRSCHPRVMCGMTIAAGGVRGRSSQLPCAGVAIATGHGLLRVEGVWRMTIDTLVVPVVEQRGRGHQWLGRGVAWSTAKCRLCLLVHLDVAALTSFVARHRAVGLCDLDMTGRTRLGLLLWVTVWVVASLAISSAMNRQRRAMFAPMTATTIPWQRRGGLRGFRLFREKGVT